VRKLASSIGRGTGIRILNTTEAKLFIATHFVNIAGNQNVNVPAKTNHRYIDSRVRPDVALYQVDQISGGKPEELGPLQTIRDPD